MGSLTQLYLIVMGASILVGLLLAGIAIVTSVGKSDSKKTSIDIDPFPKPEVGEAVKEEISDHLSQYVKSPDERRKIAKKVTEVFGKELENKLTLTTRELSKKYEGIIKEKTDSEERAWAKYTDVLTEKKDTDAVIRSVAEGLVVVDSQGKVVMMNPAAEKLLGASSKDKIGKPINDNLKEEQLVSLTKTTPNSPNKEIELVSQQDETKKILRASSAVIEDANGRTVGMVSVLSDITKQKELDRMKTNFVSSVTHELRTPLVAMEKSLVLLLNQTAGPLSKTQEEFLNIATRNLKRLSLLINDLLDLSKLEAGKMDLKRETCSIDKVITDSIESFSNWASSKSIKLEKKIESGIPEGKFDPNRVIQVLNNLIGNAIKFTPNNGTITIGASIDRPKQEIMVSVSDTGIGISKEHLPKVFDKFYQAGERVSTDISGTGIGLSIAKEIVELHGGRIWVESEKNSGTKFIFTLSLI